MAELAIRVENLGKRYAVGSNRRAEKCLSEVLAQCLKSTLSPFSYVRKQQAEECKLWALKDISFEIRKGEVVGLIGRSGAGKSTLLKILSRITEPTEGLADLNGRLGALLDVGIGFHPELTGRENIYLNGTILGMRKSQIDHKLDEIVEFAEVQRLIDVPIKRYGTGMYVRLAFAVAAQLEAEILVIDEVLAVGDVSFQKKCLAKVGDVAKGGRTVLIVSHSMPTVLSLCHRAILLNKGQLVADAQPREVLDKYLQLLDATLETPLAKRTDRQGNQEMKFVGYELRNMIGLPVAQAFSGEDITLAIKYESKNGRPLKKVYLELEFYGQFNESLFQISPQLQGLDFNEIPPVGVILLKIPHLPLQPGRYRLDIYSTVGGDMSDYIQSAAAILVAAGDYYGSGRLPQEGHGPFLVPHSWNIVDTSLSFALPG